MSEKEPNNESMEGKKENAVQKMCRLVDEVNALEKEGKMAEARQKGEELKQLLDEESAEFAKLLAQITPEHIKRGQRTTNLNWITNKYDEERIRESYNEIFKKFRDTFNLASEGEEPFIGEAVHDMRVFLKDMGIPYELNEHEPFTDPKSLDDLLEKELGELEEQVQQLSRKDCAELKRGIQKIRRLIFVSRDLDEKSGAELRSRMVAIIKLVCNKLNPAPEGEKDKE